MIMKYSFSVSLPLSVEQYESAYFVTKPSDLI